MNCNMFILSLWTNILLSVSAYHVCSSAIKNNEFMEFLGKWMEVESIILSETSQSQKNYMVRTH